MSGGAPPLDDWLRELGVEVVASSGSSSDAALARDVILDGERRFDLRATIAWVADVGCSVWAYYGLEAMEIPKRTFHRMLRASFDYPFVKFALTDDDRPMLVAEMPPAATTRDELARALVRIVVVADRLLDETAGAIADRGVLPDWSARTGRNARLLAAHRAEVEASMPAWEPPPRQRPRHDLLSRLLGRAR